MINEVTKFMFMDALFNRYILVISFLLSGYGELANMEWRGYPVLVLAAYRGYYDIVDLLILAGADANEPSSNETGNMTPLFIASLEGHLAVVNILLEANADVNKTSLNGNQVTPLRAAFDNGYSNVMWRLIQAGASIDRSIEGLKEEHAELFRIKIIIIILMQTQEASQSEENEFRARLGIS